MHNYRCTLHRIIDGDTVELDIDLGFHITVREVVRLLDVDAPETRTLDLDEKRRGIDVKNHVSFALTHAKEITITTNKRRLKGKFGRYLGTITYDGNNLNEKVREWSKL